MYMAAGRRGIIEGVRQRLMAYLFLHSCSKNGDAEARKLFFYHFEDYANLAMWKVGIFTFVAPCCAASEHCMSQLQRLGGDRCQAHVVLKLTWLLRGTLLTAPLYPLSSSMIFVELPMLKGISRAGPQTHCVWKPSA